MQNHFYWERKTSLYIVLFQSASVGLNSCVLESQLNGFTFKTVLWRAVLAHVVQFAYQCFVKCYLRFLGFNLFQSLAPRKETRTERRQLFCFASLDTPSFQRHGKKLQLQKVKMYLLFLCKVIEELHVEFVLARVLFAQKGNFIKTQ